MREVDKEMVLVLLGMSIILAIGIVAFISFFIGISIVEIGFINMWGIIFGFTGIIFGILMLVKYYR